jgi:hypothetical protein
MATRERRESELVLVTVKAASTREFLKYARTLISQQKLYRIVVDECQLTITAAGFRQSTVDVVLYAASGHSLFI